MPTTYAYDPGHHRYKHCSDEPHAHFKKTGPAYIGKCPATLDRQTANTLLNEGIPDIDAGEEYPRYIYAFHNGVVYVAVPTQPGISYHGFPWRGRPGHNRISRKIKRLLLAKACEAGQEAEVKTWLATYET